MALPLRRAFRFPNLRRCEDTAPHLAQQVVQLVLDKVDELLRALRR